GALISTLTGSHANDRVGYGGVTALTNGNYVVRTPLWGNDSEVRAGAVTWGDGTKGVAGVTAGAVTWGNGDGGTVGAVDDTNSLVGSTANDQVGEKGVTALTNGNYVVSSPKWNNIGASKAGAVTWGNGDGGTVGAVDDTNSLVGSTATDQVGVHGVTALTNGNYVVASGYWDSDTANNVG
ncbi:hypothetical protein HY29_18490, partial [Hyphomonas beringensis]